MDLKLMSCRLKELCAYLDSEFCINEGGCCFVASEIAKHLDNLGIEYTLRIFDYMGRDIKQVVNEVQHQQKNKHGNSVTGRNSCNHYYLHVEGVGDINNPSNYECSFEIGKITHKNIRWIYTNGKWNPAYEKSLNPTIRKFINLHFKRYEEKGSSIRTSEGGKVS